MTSHDTITLHTGLPVPPELVARISAWPREDDVTLGWLTALPSAIEAMCDRWEIELEPLVHESMITLVLAGHSATLGPVIVKASPIANEFRSEATALELAAAPNVARLYDVDFAHGVMAMERIMPGTQLRQVPMEDDDATRLAAATVMTIWRPVAHPDGLQPLRRWMRDLFNWTPKPDLIPTDLIRHAQQTGESLLATAPPPRLLHGDFQHHNLLQRANGDWAIIDPKGVLGDPGFDIAAWMYNPPDVTSRAGYRELSARRIAIWSEVSGLDRDRLTAWAFTGAVLSACWSASDLGVPDATWLRHTVRAAEELRHLLG